jgi:hypothetical protein
MEPGIRLKVLLDGGDETAPLVRELRAGPLRLLFENGDLRYLKVGEHEVIRRIYVAVRDRNWGTILPRFSNLAIEAGNESFQITFDAHHQEGAIDFRWHGTIVGEASGAITYRMAGEALATFWRNRIGICVLHPASSAGASYVVEHPDGSTDAGILPVDIAPHQPMREMRALTHEVIPGVRAEVRFEGDVFEMEDQRNWTDASFKTYSTPLELPYPVEVTAGTRVVQSVTLSIHGEVPPTRATSAPLTFQIQPDEGDRLPRIGLGFARHEPPLSSGEIERLRALHLAHLRVDLHLKDVAYGDLLRQATAAARALGIGLEVALFVGTTPEAELTRLADLLAVIRPPIDAWLIFRDGEIVTSAASLGLARETLAAASPRARFGGGTNQFFTELNRNRPPADAFDLIAYSVNPQVHAFDNRSLVETLPVQATTVESTRRFLGQTPVAISPITLRPRGALSVASAGPADQDPPSSVDPRQLSLLGAGWTLGSLKYVAASGAARVTYYETTGRRGVMETDAGSPRSDQFPPLPGAVFPLYHVFADVGEFATGRVVASVSSDPLRVEGIVLTQPGRTRILLANLTGESCSVELLGLPDPLRLTTLDETNVLDALRAPEAFRARPGNLVRAREGRLMLDLRPYALARLDSTAG